MLINNNSAEKEDKSI